MARKIRVPKAQQLTYEEDISAVANYYLRHHPTVEQAERAFAEAHPEVDSGDARKAFDEAVAAQISARMAEAAYALEAGVEQLPGESAAAYESRRQRLLGATASEAQAEAEGRLIGGVEMEGSTTPFQFEGQVMQEQQGGGFIDVLWTLENGNIIQVRTDFLPGDSAAAMMQENREKAELVAQRGESYGKSELDLSVQPEVLGVYYTR
jgi:hypothetical protein